MFGNNIVISIFTCLSIYSSMVYLIIILQTKPIIRVVIHAFNKTFDLCDLSLKTLVVYY